MKYETILAMPDSKEKFLKLERKLLRLQHQREDCVNRVYDTAEEAVKHIALCYSIDKDLNQLGEYYYFMKRH